MNLKITIFWIMTILDFLLISYLIYKIIRFGTINKKLKRKTSIVRVSLLIVFSILVELITVPNITNIYNIRGIISKSNLEQYITSYKLSGYKNCRITIEGKESFKQLDNEAKFKYIVELRNEVTDSINEHFFDEGGLYLEQIELFGQSTVIVIVGKDVYKKYGYKLFLNDKAIYEEKH